MTKETAMPTAKSEFILSRTGDIPLKLNGVQLSSGSTHFSNGRDRNRWHELEVFESTKYVAHIKWRSQWDGEQPHDTVITEVTLAALIDRIREYDPLAYLQGYPDGKQFAKKQARLENAIEDDWLSMITDVFMALGVTESL